MWPDVKNGSARGVGRGMSGLPESTCWLQFLLKAALDTRGSVV